MGSEPSWERRVNSRDPHCPAPAYTVCDGFSNTWIPKCRIEAFPAATSLELRMKQPQKATTAAQQDPKTTAPRGSFLPGEQGFSQSFSLNAKGKNPLGKQTKNFTSETFLWSLRGDKSVSREGNFLLSSCSEIMKKKANWMYSKNHKGYSWRTKSISPCQTMDDSKGIFLLPYGSRSRLACKETGFQRRYFTYSSQELSSYWTVPLIHGITFSFIWRS